MTRTATITPSAQATLPERIGAGFQACAGAAVLLALVARSFLGEVPYRLSIMRGVTAVSAPGAAGIAWGDVDLARVTFAAVLFWAAAAWVAGGAIRRRLEVRHGWLAVGVGAWAVVAGISAFGAANARAAWLGWAEQVSLVLAAWLMAEWAVTRHRRMIALLLIVALAGAMGIKGLWQVAVEVPERVAHFDANRYEMLEQFGWEPDTPQAQLLEMRLRDRSPLGYLGLANIFASSLIVLTLASAALAWEKLRRALDDRRRTPPARGHIHLPTLAAGLTLLVPLAAGCVLLFTGSRAGIGAFVVAALVMAGVAMGHNAMVRRRRTVLMAGGAALLALLTAIAAFGLIHDRLPSKSMTFRWYYWTASAQMATEHPMRGVGPGNFPAHYGHYRRAAAEESVKSPHNVVAQAAAEYGLPGGALLLALMVAILVAATRPAAGYQTSQPQPARPALSPRQAAGWAAAAGAVVLLSRALFEGAPGILLLFDGILPALTLSGAFLLAWWALREPIDESLPRIALVAGAMGMLLHNIVSFSLFVPGSAMLFWVAAGLAMAPTGRRGPGARGTILAAPAAGLLVVAAAVTLLIALPVLGRAVHSQRVLQAVRESSAARAVQAAEDAAQADLLDPVAAADAARLHLWALRPDDPGAYRQRIARAEQWALEAVRREPTEAAHRALAARLQAWQADADLLRYRHRSGRAAQHHLQGAREQARRHPSNPWVLMDLAEMLASWDHLDEAADALATAIRLDAGSSVLHVRLGDVLWRLGRPEAAREAWTRGRQLQDGRPSLRQAADAFLEAVARDPANLRLRIEAAELLWWAGRGDDMLAQLHAAGEIDAALHKPSVEELTDLERAQLAAMQARAEL